MTAKKEATRLLLLDAGKQIAREKGAPPHIDVRLTEVLSQVGLTTGAAYNIWTGQDDYRVDLATQVAADFCGERVDLNGIPSVSEGKAKTLSDFVGVLAQATIKRNTDDLSFFLPLRFWGVNELPEAIQICLQEAYSRADTMFSSVLEQICSHFGLTTRAGSDLAAVAAMCVTCLEGTLLRHRIAAQRGEGTESIIDRYAEMLCTLLVLHLEPVESTGDSDVWDLSERTAIAA